MKETEKQQLTRWEENQEGIFIEDTQEEDTQLCGMLLELGPGYPLPTGGIAPKTHETHRGPQKCFNFHFF